MFEQFSYHKIWKKWLINSKLILKFIKEENHHSSGIMDYENRTDDEHFGMFNLCISLAHVNAPQNILTIFYLCFWITLLNFVNLMFWDFVNDGILQQNIET